jgi:hypothetical protein
MEIKDRSDNIKLREANANGALQGISPELLPNLMHNLPGKAYRCRFDDGCSM